MARRVPPKIPTPNWHAPWELSAVVSGHLGWVRSIAFDPSNEWFVTGSTDRTIKVGMSLLGDVQIRLTRSTSRVIHFDYFHFALNLLTC